MRIYKTTYSYNGKQKTCKTWYLEFEDHVGLKHTIAVDKSKDVTSDYSKKIETMVYLKKRNQVISQDLLKWINNEIPQKLKLKLLEWGIIEQTNLSEGSTLGQHLEAFKDKLRIGFKPRMKSGSTDLHVQQTIHRVERIIEGCGFNYWQDIHLDKVQEFLSGIDVAELTYNYYRRDFMQFVKWMLKSKRVVTVPAGDEIPILAVDRIQKKGPLKSEQMEQLLKGTEKAIFRDNLTGHQRAIIYLLAVETGMRREELSHLRPACFDLERGFVNLEREFTKNRKPAHIPLKKCRIEPLRKYLEDYKQDEHLFSGWKMTHSADTLQKDLKDSGVEIEGLPVDFHSLRRTFITSLDQTTATLAEREDLARHSRGYSMTLGTYTFVTPEGMRKVIEQLPLYQWPGTDDAQRQKTA